MFKVSTDWNPKQAKLKSIILKPENFKEAIELAIQLHSLVHSKEVSASKADTFYDEVLDGVSDKCFKKITYDKSRTFAYNIWHITRIEDICSNILIAKDEQVINTSRWIDKLNCTIIDTGNALTAEEIADFSEKIDRKQLLEYRVAVGKKTQRILNQLKPEEMKRKVNPLSLERVIDEGAVSSEEEAIWLVDFWGEKILLA